MVRKKQLSRHGSKGAVQRSSKSARRDRFLQPLPKPLPQTAKDILGVLGAEGVAAEACVAAGVTKGAVWYWKEWFLADKALVPRLEEDTHEFHKPWKERKLGPGYPRYYDLTPYGRTLLTGSDARLHFPVVLEDRPMLFAVLHRESSMINWEKCGDVRHWHKMDTSLLGVTVELHTGLGPNRVGANVEIHPGPMKGYNVDLLEMDAARIIERVRFLLEHKFGMELSPEGWFPKNRSGESGPRFKVYRPEAKEWVKVASIDILGVAGLDASKMVSKGGVRDPLSKEPHYEFTDKRDAAFAASTFSNSFLMNLSAVTPLFSDNGSFIFIVPSGDAYELMSIDLNLRFGSALTDWIYDFRRVISSALSSAGLISYLLIT